MFMNELLTLVGKSIVDVEQIFDYSGLDVGFTIIFDDGSKVRVTARGEGGCYVDAQVLGP